MKILNLVIYNDDEYYNNMYIILSNYYKKFDNVKTYFYKINNSIKNEIEIEDDIFNIRDGKESIIPGILDKTIIILKYFENEIKNYDYIIRTNISSIINFELLTNELKITPIKYYDSTYIIKYNVFFASGTNIIMSNNGCKLLLDNLHIIKMINTKLNDDLIIGIIFKNINIITDDIFNNKNKFVFVQPNLNDNDIDLLIKKKYIVYRNRNDMDRNIDIIQMKKIIDKL